MPSVEVKNLKNEVVESLDLDASVFDAPLNKALIYDALKAYQANQRAGTSATKTRGDVSGSGKKLWKQKGTGRARVSSIRSPLWKGGGNVHGPQPRDWSVSFPKKMRRGAIKSVLSERLREGNLFVVDQFNLENHKTKAFASTIAGLGFEPGRVLIVESGENRNLELSARNLTGVNSTSSLSLNIYDLLYHERVVLSRAAVAELSDLLNR